MQQNHLTYMNGNNNNTQQGRRWCFTSYNEDNEGEAWHAKICENQDVRGLAMQRESCPTTGRKHYQGYIEFTRPKRMRAVQNLLEPGCHVEIAKGDRDSNLRYVTKESTRLEGPWISDVLQRGKRSRGSDLSSLATSIFEGDATYADLCAERPDVLLRYPRGLSALLSIRDQQRNRLPRLDLRVEVYWGDAGCGKTRLATTKSFPDGTECKQESFYILNAPNAGTLWFDGYSGERLLIIDDFYGWITHDTILRVLDVYRLQCAIKGGFTWAAWTTVRITSNRHPSTWYKNWNWEEDQALRRRLHAIYHCEANPIFGLMLTDELTNESINHEF